MSETRLPKPYRSRLKRVIGAAIRIVAVGYVTILVFMVAMETRLVYPGAFMNIPPQSAAGVVSVNYESADGTPLTGQLYEHPNAEHTLLYFHGNGITAARESTTAAWLGDQLNANVFVAEYRGFDGMDGSPDEAGVIADALAARDFACQRFSIRPDQLILYGQSLGGGCAVAVAAQGGAKLLVLDRTFDRMVDVAAGMYQFIPVNLLMRNRYDSIARIQNYSGPLVQIHGTGDRLIPIKHGKRLYAESPCSPKHFVEIDEMGHNDPTPPSAWEECRETIDTFLSNSP
ncbi:alpha/beta hydrolase [Novipirellula rosea]|uniref:Alpha/beta fold hydrolase n=1 Tax=Novipirellula rosea TaxID=1031540 RepID=A0ABP8N236_9BACT|tara:strand:+ start:67 stop:927 length:861 start_codon:yes stop_codon:yes gene_type:complete